MYVNESDKEESQYDMIIGRDLLTELVIEFSFKNGIMSWDGTKVHMKDNTLFNSLDNVEEIFSSESIS